MTIRQRPATANGTIFLLLEDEHGFINIIVPAKLVATNGISVRLAPSEVLAFLGRFANAARFASRAFSVVLVATWLPRH